ncbi:ferritin-like-domain-containing protein [Glomus cerebriforme]|uniref:Ferritin-like-domain-containing protein n=1 Tax=Glomus cerebriforme TaxID=658196 RepID=A0A397T742_9GLOM|nr:ferritin-like-domain-containing protein [Glomus cerebriforme]
MYSIKPGKNIGDIIRYKIRHVAAEEMLHASLVANLIVAIGRQPVFYSPEMIPFYPNPLPHFKQGHLMTHLSKADEKTLNTFIQIEKPEPKPRSGNSETFSSEFELQVVSSKIYVIFKIKIAYSL